MLEIGEHHVAVPPTGGRVRSEYSVDLIRIRQVRFDGWTRELSAHGVERLFVLPPAYVADETRVVEHHALAAEGERSVLERLVDDCKAVQCHESGRVGHHRILRVAVGGAVVVTDEAVHPNGLRLEPRLPQRRRDEPRPQPARDGIGRLDEAGLVDGFVAHAVVDMEIGLPERLLEAIDGLGRPRRRSPDDGRSPQQRRAACEHKVAIHFNEPP